jgi:hypothetical protein
MRRLAIVFVTIILLGLTTFAEKSYYGRKASTSANTSLSKRLTVTSAPSPCSCSCGKNCDGSCSTHLRAVI